MTESEPDRNRDRVPPLTSTEWSQDAAEEGGELPLPPFFAGAEEPAPTNRSEPVTEEATEEPWAAGASEVEEAPEDPWAAGAEEVEESAEGSAFPFDDMGGPADEAAEPEQPWSEDPFAADAELPVLEAEEAPVAEAMPDTEPVDDFPVEAFHLPEAAQGQESAALATPDHTPERALDLADRLERLAVALRVRGTAALTDQLAGGDRFDALLTGLLAGFLAAGDD